MSVPCSWIKGALALWKTEEYVLKEMGSGIARNGVVRSESGF